MKIKKDIYRVKEFKDIEAGTCFTLIPDAVNEIYIKINENAAYLIDELHYSAVNLVTGELRIMEKDEEVYLYEKSEVIVK